jgi:hypothetical protein
MTTTRRLWAVLPRRARHRVIFGGIALLAPRIFDAQFPYIVYSAAIMNFVKYMSESGRILGKIDHALPPS